jgi:hypothetical protein
MAKAYGPIEVWLSQKNMQVTCTVVHEDEHTETLDVDALSMRGAQREMTDWFIAQGYKPAGRWSIELTEVTPEGDERAVETSRQFVPAKSDK